MEWSQIGASMILADLRTLKILLELWDDPRLEEQQRVLEDIQSLWSENSGDSITLPSCKKKSQEYPNVTENGAIETFVHRVTEDISKSHTTQQGISINQARFILTFNENDKDIRSIIHKHWDILSKDPAVGKLVTPRPLFCYRRNTSIGDMITHSHFQKHLKAACCKTPGSFRCGACEQCHFIKTSNKFGRDSSNYEMHHYICCNTTHIVYLFTCHCGSMHGIDRLHGDIRGNDLDNKLLQLETTWIFKLNT
ncbi:hypothetical protein XELAEV_18024730mg [Xenopus laevis]|uniref:Uncharacterized protein n=1 Tax=Xenopus laevis TaxID=8355 RepID=A0A974HLP0_XENLA|nr:hypothetical protein XELAEV_18024730mg [Xenopus laevis]